MNARREDFWKQFDDDGDLEEAAHYIENHPDAGVTEVLAQIGLDLDRRDEVARLLEEFDGDDEQETRVGHTQKDDCDLYGGRSSTASGRVRHAGNTPIGVRGWLGNPFVPEEFANDTHRRQEEVTIVETREESVRRFATWFLDEVDERPDLRRALYERVRGNILGGWCQRLEDDEPTCHLEVVAEVADRLEERGDAEWQ